MLNRVMVLWFVLTAMALAFVAIDIRKAPVPPVMKSGFVLLTAYTGPIGAFLYVIGCREPLPGLHQRYVDTRWRQVLGSTMHCVAGDGVGILAGAVVASYLTLNRPLEIALEYALGFAFGWTIFQALFIVALHPAPAPAPVLAASHEGHAGHAKVSRKQIAGMTFLSVAVFALAFVAQAKVTTLGIDYRPAHAGDATGTGQAGPTVARHSPAVP